MNREQWLNDLLNHARPLFELHKHPIPSTVRVGIGRTSSKKYLGECYSPDVSDDKHREIWIAPYSRDSIEIASTLVHELCHAALPFGVGHRLPFVRLARAMQLEGKPTATHAGDAFRQTWEPILKEMPPYPGGVVEMRRTRSSSSPSLYKLSCSHCLANAWVSPKMLAYTEDFGTRCFVKHCEGDFTR